jgi:hypothetical protein
MTQTGVSLPSETAKRKRKPADTAATAAAAVDDVVAGTGTSAHSSLVYMHFAVLAELTAGKKHAAE